MTSSNSEARKSREAEMLAEAGRLAVEGRVLSALQRVYPTAEWLEGSALRDALEDEGLLT